MLLLLLGRLVALVVVVVVLVADAHASLAEGGKGLHSGGRERYGDGDGEGVRRKLGCKGVFLSCIVFGGDCIVFFRRMVVM